MSQVHPQLVREPSDPVVGDMTCAPPMSIHTLLAQLDQPLPCGADDDGVIDLQLPAPAKH